MERSIISVVHQYDFRSFRRKLLQKAKLQVAGIASSNTKTVCRNHFIGFWYHQRISMQLWQIDDDAAAYSLMVFSVLSLYCVAVGAVKHTTYVCAYWRPGTIGSNYDWHRSIKASARIASTVMNVTAVLAVIYSVRNLLEYHHQDSNLASENTCEMSCQYWCSLCVYIRIMCSLL